MTDAATRLAFDIRDHAEELERSDASSITFLHHPIASPEGCAGAYTITIAPAGSLGVHCDGHAYGTTSHRKFADADRALTVSHRAGEAAKIILRKTEAGIRIDMLE
jgi:hypothetical protein